MNTFVGEFPELYSLFEATFKRICALKHNEDVPAGLRSAFRMYVRREGRWADIRMNLDSLRREAEVQVSLVV
jgi:hypothetical protein